MAGLDWGGTAYQPLEILQPRAGLPAAHRMKKAYPGIPFSVRVACMGGVYPYQFSLSGAPAGMTINPLSGLVSWPSPVAGSYSITVTVEDTKNVTDSETWSLTVGTSGFVFVDAVNGHAFPTGTGAIGNPYRTLADVFLHTTAGSITYLRAGSYNFAGVPSLGTVCDPGNMIGDEIVINPANCSCIWIGYPGDTAPSISFGGQTCATGCILGWQGDTLWMEGLNCHSGYWKFFNGGGGSNGGGTFWRNEFHAHTSSSSNTSFLMWNHFGPPLCLGPVIQENNFHNEDGGPAGGGLPILLYDTQKTLIEANMFTSVGTTFSPKSGNSKFTFRGNTAITLHYALSSNFDDYFADGTDATGEICFNAYIGPFTDPSDIGCLEFGPTWIDPVGTINVYRNTINGPLSFSAPVGTNYGPIVCFRNVIVNSNSTTTPYTFMREISGFPAPGWAAVQDTENTKGLPAANIISQTTGALQGTYRTNFLYFRGFEVPTDASPSPTFTSATSTSFTVGAAGTFTVVATSSVTSITEAGSLPAGVTYTDNADGTGTLAGTPVNGTAGVYRITFTATNSSGSTGQDFTLTINAATPSLGIPVAVANLQAQGML